jgi:hypothetical protein
VGTKWKANQDWPEGYRGCKRCNEVKPLSEFHKHKQCCGSCFRTLEEIKECGNKEKRGNICQ